jgi:hypothetical protein
MSPPITVPIVGLSGGTHPALDAVGVQSLVSVSLPPRSDVQLCKPTGDGPIRVTMIFCRDVLGTAQLAALLLSRWSQRGSMRKQGGVTWRSTKFGVDFSSTSARINPHAAK